MTHELEAPADWASLYQARGDDVNPSRPVLTGDVFRNVPTIDSAGEKKRDVLLLQHPCSLRRDGVNLVPKLLVAKVQNFRPLESEEWSGFARQMPLPDLRSHEQNQRKRHFAALFDDLFIVSPEQIVQGERYASMSPAGINTLLQRWVYNSTRAVIPTSTFHECNAAVFEEVDLIEEWCDDRNGLVTELEAASECVTWLREPVGDDGPTRQETLRDPQQRSPIRRQMRAHLKNLSRPS
ncbi:hypothetical protein GTW71_29530 [Streptomyces sp. SID6041]|nr:hypothetical protein [Streptomyces sp. SID6041]